MKTNLHTCNKSCIYSIYICTDNKTKSWGSPFQSSIANQEITQVCGKFYVTQSNILQNKLVTIQIVLLKSVKILLEKMSKHRKCKHVHFHY